MPRLGIGFQAVYRYTPRMTYGLVRDIDECEIDAKMPTDAQWANLAAGAF